MTFRLGLTGSIGMGKSTTAKLFADAGCALWDADAAVHRLYAKGGAAVAPMKAAFPTAIVDQAVSRVELRKIISSNSSALAVIESIVHPFVAQDRAAFLEDTEADIVVFDIPLLYETGGERAMNAVAVVYVSDDVQEARVMERGTMTRAEFLAIRDKQIPTSEKRARADFEIEADTLEHARAQVHDVIDQIKSRMTHA
jgi:dephospho-CoA kinase